MKNRYFTGLSQLANEVSGVRPKLNFREFSLSDDYFDTGAGQNIPSAYTSGLATCDLQESVATYNSSGVLSPFSNFTTIMSDCGAPEATNSANSVISSLTLNRQLQPGSVYKYQLNVVDEANNAAQITLADSVVTSYVPVLNIFNVSQNQSAFPDTSVNFAGVVTDLDEGETITVTFEVPNANITQTQTFTGPIVSRGFTFSLLGADLPLGVYGNAPGSLSPILISADDGNQSTVVYYQGAVTSKPTPDNVTNDEIKTLFTDTWTRAAGALFFRVGTKPNLRDKGTGNLTFTNVAANDYYCYDDGTDAGHTGANVNTSCFNLVANSLAGDSTSTKSAQMWYKEIGDKEYPFIVQFYEQPLGEEELRVNDTGW